MKLSLAVVAALAITTPTLSISILSEPQIIELLSNAPAPVHEAKPHAKSGWQSVKSYVDSMTSHKPAPRPCHGMVNAQKGHNQVGPSNYLPGPIGSLLSRLGFTPASKGDHHRSHIHMEVISTIKDQVASHRHAEESFKDRFEEMIHRVESETIPLMEGGIVRIMPIFDEFGGMASPEKVALQQEAQHPKFKTGHWREISTPVDNSRVSEWQAMAGKDGVKAVHHHHHDHPYGKNAYHGHAERHGKSFGCRLNHALKSLKPAESLSLAFVLGAGIGSLLHLVFMVLLLSIRRLRGGQSERCKLRQERRAARAARRAARKAAKQDTKEGSVRLESGDEGEVLPAYGEDERDKLVEKA